MASGRNQGVVKVDPDNNLKWILAPHKGWGKSGRTGEGFNTSDYLLTAVNSENEPFSDDVRSGILGTDEFEWSTGQHALSILDTVNLLLFDNGLSRNLKGKPTYSRAVEYKIDEENMTVQQVWQYGKSRGLSMFSPITSDVDVLPTTQNRLITVGNIRASGELPHSKLIEITYPENKEVFERFGLGTINSGKATVLYIDADVALADKIKESLGFDSIGKDPTGTWIPVPYSTSSGNRLDSDVDDLKKDLQRGLDQL